MLLFRNSIPDKYDVSFSTIAAENFGNAVSFCVTAVSWGSVADFLSMFLWISSSTASAVLNMFAKTAVSFGSAAVSACSLVASLVSAAVFACSPVASSGIAAVNLGSP